MKLLLDENVDASYFDELKKIGHDVLHICKTKRRIKDSEIYTIAVEEKRCIITHDSDYDVYMQKENFGLIRIKGLVNNEYQKLSYSLNIVKSKKNKTGKVCNIFCIQDKFYYEIIPKYSKKGKFKRIHKLRKEYEL